MTTHRCETKIPADREKVVNNVNCLLGAVLKATGAFPLSSEGSHKWFSNTISLWAGPEEDSKAIFKIPICWQSLTAYALVKRKVKGGSCDRDPN